jgi:hypothetical protein
VQQEVYSETNLDQIGGDIESAKNLNHCRDSLAHLINTFLSSGGGLQKADKVSKAQEVVDQAKKLMGDNVKKMIEN